MRIAICSDVHDNIWKLERALPLMNEANVLLFCGDFCAPFTLVQMAHGFEGPVHAVLGNNDGDQRLLATKAAESGNFTLHGQFAELEFDGMSFALNHYPDIALRIAQAGKHDVVCYGHNHTLKIETIGSTWLLNPGEIMGRFGSSTFLMFDTETKRVQKHDIQ